MNFSSLDFWVALGTGLLLVGAAKWCCTWRGIRENTVDRLLLAGLSLSLLCYESVLTLLVFLLVLILTYFSLFYIQRATSRLKLTGLTALVFLQFAPLLYYKYSGFIAGTMFGAETDLLRGIVIPVGVSFYTFQMVGFVIDHYRCCSDFPSFLDYLNFASFFPQIVAGPIERKKRLLPQVREFQFRFDRRNIARGCRWIVLGMFLKLALADNLAVAAPWIRSPSDNPYVIWMGSLIFGLRIYFDFAGYSLIALGLGRLLGIELTLNFLSPYTAVNIREFWQKWHRSLSTWFKDYLYIPLGGNRSGVWPLSIAIVFLVSGIWHGAGWNYMLWGMAHGVLVMAYRPLESFVKWLPSPVAWALNMLLITLTWVFFYQTDTPVLFAKLGVLVRPMCYGPGSIVEAAKIFGSLGDFINASVWIWASIMFICLERISCLKYGEPYALMRGSVVSVGLAAITITVAPVVQNGFIYFNF